LKRTFNLDLQQLFTEVDAFIRSFLEMPDEKDYLILVLWVFHSYLIEKFDTSPMLYFYGVKETGKTRAGEVPQSYIKFGSFVFKLHLYDLILDLINHNVDEFLI